MLCAAKQLDAHADRPFAAAQGDKATRSCCAQGDTVRQLRLMRIGRPKGRPYYGFAGRSVHGGKGTFLSLHPDISRSVSFANCNSCACGAPGSMEIAAFRA